MKNKIYVVLISLIVGLIISGIICSGKKVFDSTIGNSDKTIGVVNNSLGDKFVAYIPLDDRPINVDRVKYLSESMGYTLKIPDADLYSTKLDGNGTNSNGTKYGNPESLARWLYEMEKSGCDYYIISLDQLFSGGLVGSRYLTLNDEKIFDMDYVKQIFENLVNNSSNKIYLYDSVMRLASTLDFEGYTIDDYMALSNYASVERNTLKNENLNVENIVKGYTKDTNGNLIKANVTSEKLQRYLSARERKLKLMDYYFEVIGNKENVFLFTGIDDSSTSKNIQTNEIDYMNKKAKEEGINVVIRDGIDELGMLSFSKLVYDVSNTSINIKTYYYGDNANNNASGYSSQTVKENYEDLLKTFGLKSVQADEDVSVLIFTNPNQESELMNTSIKLFNQYIDNINNKIPTIIVDASKDAYSKTFTNMMVDNVPLGYLIGYSSWNDFSNTVGIALSEGITRYLYLIGNNKNNESDKAFINLMSLSYIKDIAYKNNAMNEMGKVGDSNFVNNHMTPYANKIINNLKNSNFISNINNYEEKGVSSISVSNYRFPWNRTFEMRFDVNSNLGNPNNNKYEQIKTVTHLSFIKDSLTSDKMFYPDSNVTRKEVAKWVCLLNNLPLVDTYQGYYNDVDFNNSYWKYIETATKYGYFKGEGNSKFSPDNDMNRAQLVTLVIQIAEKDNIVLPKEKEVNFSDIEEGTWYYDKVKKAAEAGIINGYTDGTFKPARPATKTEAVVVLSRLYKRDEDGLKCNNYSKANPFKDVSTDHWAYNILFEAYYDHTCITN